MVDSAKSFTERNIYFYMLKYIDIYIEIYIETYIFKITLSHQKFAD